MQLSRLHIMQRSGRHAPTIGVCPPLEALPYIFRRRGYTADLGYADLVQRR